MLPARHRMRRGADFTVAVRQGRRSGRPGVVVHLAAGGADHDPGGPVLVGLVVSKAVGSAVTRNRVKRRLRALLRERLGTFPPGARVVVRANPPAAVLPGPALGADLDRALARVVPVPRSSRDR